MATTTATTPATTPATSSNGATPARKAPAPTPKGYTVMALLSKAPAGLTRGALAHATGVAKGWARLLGAGSKAGAGYGVNGAAGLLGLGLVRCVPCPATGRLLYTITAKGTKALASAGAVQAPAAPAKGTSKGSKAPSNGQAPAAGNGAAPTGKAARQAKKASRKAAIAAAVLAKVAAAPAAPAANAPPAAPVVLPVATPALNWQVAPA